MNKYAAASQYTIPTVKAKTYFIYRQDWNLETRTVTTTFCGQVADYKAAQHLVFDLQQVEFKSIDPKHNVDFFINDRKLKGTN